MSNRRIQNLGSDVEEDVPPEDTRDLQQKSNTGETTSTNQIEMVSLGGNNPFGGARKKEVLPVGNYSTGENLPVQERSRGLPADVRVDAVPISPDVQVPNPMTADHSQSNPESAEKGKGVQDDLEQTVTSNLQENLKIYLSKAVEASSVEWTPSQSPASPSSSDNSLSSNSKLEVEVEDIPDSDVPIHIRLPVHDVLLLHSEKEIKAATSVKNHLETEFRVNKTERISVLLYDDLSRDIGNHIGCLQEGMARCTFIFILVTEEFCNCGLSRHLSEDCLIQSIQDPSKKWSVVPLFTEPKRKANYVIPAGLHCLKGVNYFIRDEFYFANMSRMIEDKLCYKRQREEKRREDIEEWKENRRHELRRQKIIDEQRKKQLKESREKELEQLINNYSAIQSDPNLVLKPSPSLPLMANQGYPYPYPTIEYKNPNTGQVEVMMLPTQNMCGIQQDHFMGRFPYPLPQQFGQLPQNYGSPYHSVSVPGNMNSLQSNPFPFQPQGGTATWGGLTDPVAFPSSLSHQQETIMQPESDNLHHKPKKSFQPEPTENVDRIVQSTAYGDECSQRESLAKAVDPEKIKAANTRFKVRDGKYGSGNGVLHSSVEATKPKKEQFDAVSYLQQRGNSNPGGESSLDSAVEEDAHVSGFTEETQIKEHYVHSDIASDAGYFSDKMSASKVTGASYIKQSLGSSKGAPPLTKHATSDSTGDPSYQQPGGSFSSTVSGQPLKGDTSPSQAVVREIHHHHHHESEGKNVFIIQNCPAVNIGDSTTISNVRHEGMSRLTQQDDFRGVGDSSEGEISDNEGVDPGQHPSIDPHRNSDIINTLAETISDGNDTDVKFCLNTRDVQNLPPYNIDQETSLKTVGDNRSAANASDRTMSIVSNQNNSGQDDKGCLPLEPEKAMRKTPTTQQNIISRVENINFGCAPLHGLATKYEDSAARRHAAESSASRSVNANAEVPNTSSSAKPFLIKEHPAHSADVGSTTPTVEEGFVLVTSNSQTGEAIADPLSCQGALRCDNSGSLALSSPLNTLCKEVSTDEGSSVDPEFCASGQTKTNFSRRRSRKDKKDCELC